MNTTGNGEGLSNRVYFSALLPEVCPVTYNGLVEILDRYGVPHSLLEGTKDIWCRDYMPIQSEFFKLLYLKIVNIVRGAVKHLGTKARISREVDRKSVV